MREGWTYKKLGEVCTSITDGSHNPPKGIEHSEYRMISSQNIFDDDLRIDDETVRFLTEEDHYKEDKRTKLSKDVVLLTIVGTIGRACVLKGIEGFITLQRSVSALHPSSEIQPRFLMHCLIGNRERLNQEAHGIAQRGIYLRQLSELEIPIPPLSEQQSIVTELDKINELISLKKAQLSDLDSLAQSIFYDMFGDYEDDTPLAHFINSLSGGKSLAGNAPCINKVLKTGAVTYDCFDGNAVKDLPIDYVPLPEHLLKDGDLLVSRMNTPELVGSCAYVWKAPANTYLPDRLWRATLKQGNNPIYLWFSIIQLKAKEQIRTLASGTSGSMKNISKPRFLSVKIKNAPLSLQQEFAKRIELIEQQKVQISSTIKDLETLLASRMQYWFD